MNVLIFVHVPKSDVINLNFEQIDMTLKRLSKEPNKGRDSLVVTFSGYDHVPDEIWEIDAIRKWVEKLFKKYPYFLYFLHRESKADEILLPCLLDMYCLFRGEKLTCDEWLARGYTMDTLPRHKIDMFMSDEKLQHMITSIITYGEEIGDIGGSIAIASDLYDWFR